MDISEAILTGRHIARTEIQSEWQKISVFLANARQKVAEIEASDIAPNGELAELLFDELSLILRKLSKFESIAFSDR